MTHWRLKLFLACLLGSIVVFVAPPKLSMAQTPTFGSIDGLAHLVAVDGTYLGIVSSNEFDSNSICDQLGPYGSQFSDSSVRNGAGAYGSEFSPLSAYDQFTSTPPAILLNGQIIGYLTKNQSLSGAVDPDALFAVYDCTD